MATYDGGEEDADAKGKGKRAREGGEHGGVLVVVLSLIVVVVADCGVVVALVAELLL